MLKNIIELGQMIDKLDLDYEYYSFDDINLSTLTSIEGNIIEIQKKKLNSDELIYYKYTVSNYYAILMQVARENFNEVKHYSCKLQQWLRFEEADLNIKIERISLYRQAIDLYDLNSRISNEYMAQISTNLANLYHEMGRIVESIEVLNDTRTLVSEFPMALGNYAIKCYTLSKYCTDQSVKRYLLELALREFKYLFENDIKSKYITKDQIVKFEEFNFSIQNLVDKYFLTTNSWETSMDVNSNYKTWCSNNHLSLNYINIVFSGGNIDNIHIPNLGKSFNGDSNKRELTYYSWFNTIKQEFNTARYNLYLTNSEKNEVHESQENNFLINTLDYPIIGYKTELLKSSLKTAYGILDKIGLFCSHFFDIKTPPGKIDFNKWYREVEIQVALSSHFSALYWLSKDLDFKSGHFKNMRKLRNVIEHRYLRVLENYSVSISDELQETDRYEYTISYIDLSLITLETLKVVRSAIFYLVNGFNAIYLNMIYNNQDNLFIPLRLSEYIDEWKN